MKRKEEEFTLTVHFLKGVAIHLTEGELTWGKPNFYYVRGRIAYQHCASCRAADRAIAFPSIIVDLYLGVYK